MDLVTLTHGDLLTWVDNNAARYDLNDIAAILNSGITDEAAVLAANNLDLYSILCEIDGSEAAYSRDGANTIHRFAEWLGTTPFDKNNAGAVYAACFLGSAAPQFPAEHAASLAEAFAAAPGTVLVLPRAYRSQASPLPNRARDLLLNAGPDTLIGFLATAREAATTNRTDKTFTLDLGAIEYMVDRWQDYATEKQLAWLLQSAHLPLWELTSRPANRYGIDLDNPDRGTFTIAQGAVLVRADLPADSASYLLAAGATWDDLPFFSGMSLASLHLLDEANIPMSNWEKFRNTDRSTLQTLWDMKVPVAMWPTLAPHATLNRAARVNNPEPFIRHLGEWAPLLRPQFTSIATCDGQLLADLTVAQGAAETEKWFAAIPNQQGYTSVDLSTALLRGTAAVPHIRRTHLPAIRREFGGGVEVLAMVGTFGVTKNTMGTFPEAVTTLLAGHAAIAVPDNEGNRSHEVNHVLVARYGNDVATITVPGVRGRRRAVAMFESALSGGWQNIVVDVTAYPTSDDAAAAFAEKLAELPLPGSHGKDGISLIGVPLVNDLLWDNLAVGNDTDRRVAAVRFLGATIDLEGRSFPKSWFAEPSSTRNSSVPDTATAAEVTLNLNKIRVALNLGEKMPTVTDPHSEKVLSAVSFRRLTT